MQNKEKAVSVSLILHLVMSLLFGVIGAAVQSLTESTAVIKSVTLILTVVRYAVPIFLYCKMASYTPFVSSLNEPRKPKNRDSIGNKVFLLVFGLALSVTVLNVIGLLTDAFLYAMGQVSEPIALQNGVVYSFIKTVCLAALVEEILFRGVVLHAFSDRSDNARIVISATTFALMHGNIRQFFYAFATGLVIATFAIITDSLFSAVFLLAAATAHLML